MGDRAAIPAGFVLIKCEPCNGTGKVKKRPGAFYNWKQDRRRRPSCFDCDGIGHVVVRKREVQS